MRRVFLKLSAATLAAGLVGPARAQSPTPLRIVVPFPAGGATDVLARELTTRLGAALGQPVVVENRPGAGGTIGAAAVARAGGDGNTVLLTTSTFVTAAHMYRNLPFRPMADLAPITAVGRVPLLLVASRSTGVDRFPALVELSRSRDLSYASPGVGTPIHLATELLKARSGLAATHIPYATSFIPDLTTGRVDFGFDAPHTSMAHVRAGRLAAVGQSGSQRAATMPDVPLLRDAGAPGFDAQVWYGFFAPAGTPRPRLDLLTAELRRVSSATETAEKLVALGIDQSENDRIRFVEEVQRDYERWGALVKELKLAPA